MPQLWTNNGRALLTGAITASDTAIVIQSSKADTFPAANTGAVPVSDATNWFKATLQDTAGNTEIIYVRTRASGSGTLTNVLRGQEGTTARAFAINSVLEQRVTAQDLDNFRGTSTALEALIRNDTSDDSGAGIMAFSYSRAYAVGKLGRWLQDLALAAGSTLTGWAHNWAGSTTRTVSDRLRDRTSIKDFGARTDLADNLALVNAAIAGRTLGPLEIPDGRFVVSAKPTNPNGVPFRGPGGIATAEAVGGFRQWNTYADEGHILVGREYLYRVYARLLLGPAGAFATLKIFVYGDSTVEGFVASPSTLNGNYLVENLLPAILQRQGIAAIRKADDAVNATVINRGVSGTNWSHLNAIPDLSSSTDLLIIKYGINDGALLPGQSVAARIANMATNMRAKLAAIRAAANGGLGQVAILLMGPNATNDSGHGRNEEWYEQVRQVYVQAARDYNCAYFDTYAFLQDARLSALLWMDNPTPATTGDALFTNNSSVHPLETMNMWIWGGMVQHAFPREMIGYTATNAFVSIGNNSNYEPDGTAKTPDLYGFGMTWELALAANNYPVDGLLVTYRNPDTYAYQQLIPLAGSGRMMTRFANSGSTWGSIWTGNSVALTFSNSWVDFGGSWAPATATRDQHGQVVVEGLIKSGTTTIGTVMATLPVGYRPAADHLFVVASSTGTPVRLRVATTGEIIANTAADATQTSLSGIAFRAA